MEYIVLNGENLSRSVYSRSEEEETGDAERGC